MKKEQLALPHPQACVSLPWPFSAQSDLCITCIYCRFVIFHSRFY